MITIFLFNIIFIIIIIILLLFGSFNFMQIMIEKNLTYGTHCMHAV